MFDWPLDLEGSVSRMRTPHNVVPLPTSVGRRGATVGSHSVNSSPPKSLRRTAGCNTSRSGVLPKCMVILTGETQEEPHLVGKITIRYYKYMVKQWIFGQHPPFFNSQQPTSHIFPALLRPRDIEEARRPLGRQLSPKKRGKLPILWAGHAISSDFP